MSKSAVKISQDLLSNPLCEQDQDFLRMVTALDTAMKRMDAFNQEKVTRSCCQWPMLLPAFPLDLARCNNHRLKVVLDFSLLKRDSLKPSNSQTRLVRCLCLLCLQQLCSAGQPCPPIHSPTLSRPLQTFASSTDRKCVNLKPDPALGVALRIPGWPLGGFLWQQNMDTIPPVPLHPLLPNSRDSRSASHL